MSWVAVNYSYPEWFSEVNTHACVLGGAGVLLLHLVSELMICDLWTFHPDNSSNICASQPSLSSVIGPAM